MGEDGSILGLTTQIVSSYLQNNNVDKDDVLPLLENIHSKLSELSDSNAASAKNLRPAVPIDESVTDDYIYCLEDGKPFKMLKKHLMSVYSMTPQDYRNKWNLAADYPMVAPNYATKRQELAKQSGLGRKRS